MTNIQSAANTATEAVQNINLDVPDLSIETIRSTAQTIYESAIEQLSNSGNVWISLAVILVAFACAWLVRKIVRPKLHDKIDTYNLSFRANRILKNLTKLTMPLAALVIITLAMIVINGLSPNNSFTLMDGVAKLLIAWIFIRVFSQIIENSFTRQIVAGFAWVLAAISILGIMTETKQALDAVGMDFGDFRLSLLTIVKFAIAFVMLLTLTRLLVNVAERSLSNVTDLSPSARVLIIKTIKVALVSLAILIGVTASGINLSALAFFGGALGLGIGFGLQKVISNLFSGMLLLMDKSIKPGDVIELPGGTGAFGWVNQLGARYVSIITRDNKEYLIPNEDFITQPVINWSYSDHKIRVETKFGVDYESDPHQVKAIAIEVTRKVKRVVEDPKPVCHLVEFGDSSLNFVLRYWIEDAENGVTNTKGDVMLGLWDAFKENNIKIPFPHRVIIDRQTAIKKTEPRG